MWWRTRCDDAVAHGPRRAQPIEERRGQLAPTASCPQEVAIREGRRLADVVEQGREADDGSVGAARVDRAQRVVPEVLAGDLVLRDAALCRELR